MPAPQRIVVVGASLAGQRTVAALRRHGYDGELVLVGEEPHLPYDRPPLSKQLLAGTMEPGEILLADEDAYEGVDLRLGVRATRLVPRERRVECSDGSSVSGDHVVVATGSTARRFPGLEQRDGLFLLRTLDDSLGIREAFAANPRVVVVGAGFIGCEVAATARGLGLEVAMVEPLPAPVVRGVGRVIGAAIADLHRANGVDLRLGVGVEAVEGSGRLEGVRLSDGKVLEADVVVAGVGAAPATEWLEGSGLVLADGVVCDARCRAEGGDGAVWAAGDVARWPSGLFGQQLRVEHWTNATEQGSVIAANLLGTGSGDIHDPVPYVWSDQYDRRVQILGVPDPQVEPEVVHGSLADGKFVALLVRDDVIRAVVGMSSARALMRCRPHVGRRIDRDALAAALA